MTVISIDKDPGAMTMTIVAEFDAPARRVWEVWANPRQLEKWWGPPCVASKAAPRYMFLWDIALTSLRQ